MKKLFTCSVILAVAFCMVIKTSAQSANTSLSNLASVTKVNQNLTPGVSNTFSLGTGAIGWKNLFLTNGLYLDNHRFLNNFGGSGNNFIGTDAGKSISSGPYNTGVGYNALYNDSNGTSNTAVGYDASYKNGSGFNNTAIGVYALYLNLSNYNTAIGGYALYKNTTGNSNAASGYGTLASNSTGSYNTASGFEALDENATGSYNTATGYEALIYNTNSYNTAHGAFALTDNTSGYNNTATGASALYHNNTGIDNTANGLDALSANTTGNYNTGIGDDALANTTASDYNTAVGSNAGFTYDNGYNNVFVGANTDVNGAGYYNDIAIGQGTVCTDVSQVTMGNGATATYRAYANWSNISDGRFKKNIQQNVPGLKFINKLQPVTYTLDATGIDNFLHQNQSQDKQVNIQAKAAMNKALAAKEKTVYTGFVAQDVEKVAKSLNYDFSGVDAAKNDKDLYGLRYAEFVVPLVKAVQELSNMNDTKDSAINDLQNQINQLKAMIVSSATGKQSTYIASASLAQNVPNPFGNTTTINYTLPQTYLSAKLIITDNKGVVLKQISLNTKGKGNVNVDASTLAAGAYHYALYVDGKMIDSRQMISSK